MKQSELETLRAQAAKVELPQSVREAVMSEATALDQAEQQSSTHLLTRRNFLRVGVAAAAVGVGAFLGLSIFGNGDSDKGFVLTAYAEGIEQADGSVLASTDFTNFPLTRYPGDPFPGATLYPLGSSGDGTWFDVTNVFGLTCNIEGYGAESVTYELEGPNCEYAAEYREDDEVGVFFSVEDNSIREKSFWVPCKPDGDTAQYVCAHFPMSETLKELSDRYTAMEKEAWGDVVFDFDFFSKDIEKYEEVFYREDHQLVRDYLLAAQVEFSRYIPGTVLHISVKYSDGSVLEKRYELAPIDNFEEVYGAYLDSLLEVEYQMDAAGITDELMIEWTARNNDIPQLYTIREIDG